MMSMREGGRCEMLPRVSCLTWWHSEPTPHAPKRPPRTAFCHLCWAKAERNSSARRSTGRVGHWCFQVNFSFLQGPIYCLVTEKRNIFRRESIGRNTPREECASREPGGAGSFR